jgi:hypothetical protein
MPDGCDPLFAFAKACATVTVALALLFGALAVSEAREGPAALHHALMVAVIALGD